ncbi:hypothetical protein OGAPHI_004607 [Ogataea philodendri]|uniref:Uncharacterized protein n=1 Tax=Ogataea philodendri TaxID=1378263 RepID=A0A9P8P387_9ASCO|nr:uncharacterized protein OGAPHI_004607 [Ogataea philodendri]KAH3664255.1 hypothetical protein OGAPHI_004607 [Ogataea philodendri]
MVCGTRLNKNARLRSPRLNETIEKEIASKWSMLAGEAHDKRELDGGIRRASVLVLDRVFSGDWQDRGVLGSEFLPGQENGSQNEEHSDGDTSTDSSCSRVGELVEMVVAVGEFLEVDSLVLGLGGLLVRGRELGALVRGGRTLAAPFFQRSDGNGFSLGDEVVPRKNGGVASKQWVSNKLVILLGSVLERKLDVGKDLVHGVVRAGEVVDVRRTFDLGGIKVFHRGSQQRLATDGEVVELVGRVVRDTPLSSVGQGCNLEQQRRVPFGGPFLVVDVVDEHEVVDGHGITKVELPFREFLGWEQVCQALVEVVSRRVHFLEVVAIRPSVNSVVRGRTVNITFDPEVVVGGFLLHVHKDVLVSTQRSHDRRSVAQFRVLGLNQSLIGVHGGGWWVQTLQERHLRVLDDGISRTLGIGITIDKVTLRVKTVDDEV